MNFWKKKKVSSVMLFGDAASGYELGKRLAARGFCSRLKVSAGLGGEKESGSGCPGTSSASGGMRPGPAA